MNIGKMIVSKELYKDIWGKKPIVCGHEKIRKQLRILYKEDYKKVLEPPCYIMVVECDMFEKTPVYSFRATVKNGIEEVWENESDR